MPELDLDALAPPDPEAAALREEALRRLVRLSGRTGDALPPQRPTLVDGMLRRGHKMLIAGPPKAGKTWLAIDLAYSVANGAPWMGHQCAKGEVVFVDGEMDPASFYHRCQSVAAAKWPGSAAAGTVGDLGEGILALHLRGDQDTDVLGLLALLRAYYEGREPPALVVIDPIYKLLRGDENSNSEMRAFVKGLDAIAAWGPSVCVTHHHAKGRAGDRLVTDRAAGAGVFSRDPDAFVDLTPLDVREGTDAWESLLSAFPRMDGEGDDEWHGRVRSKAVLRANLVLREFPDRYGGEWAFDWPLMVPVDGMRDVPEEGSQRAAQARGAEATMARADAEWAPHDSMLTDAIDALAAAGVERPGRDAAYRAYAKRCGDEGIVPKPRASFDKETKPSGSGRLSWVYDRASGGLVPRS